jgi:hypothetical protein
MIGLIGVFFSSLLLHPSQESLAELQFNEKTQRVEISLRLSVADEQQLLRGVSQAAIDELVEDADAMKAAAIAVLSERMRFGTAEELEARPKRAAEPTPYLWAGRQSEGAHVWWFFEYDGTPEQLTHVRCSLFQASTQAADVAPSADAHHHVHAKPISTFVVLPRKRDDPSLKPKSFTTTNDRPVMRITW